MQYTFENIDELIAMRLAGEIGESENSLLEKWLSDSEANQQYFGQMQRLWQKTALVQGDFSQTIDVEAALTRTRTKIQQTAVKGKARIVNMRPWLTGIAASILLAAAAIWFFQHPGLEKPVVLATFENSFRDTLSDGSAVALNAHSSISATFDKKKRHVKMRGEAFFEVAKNPDKPFIIDVNRVEVTVIGTRFNIDNRSDSTKVVVSVEEGRVRVQFGSQIVFLNAGEQASVDCSSGAILRSNVLPAGNVKAWFDRRFVFDDVPLSEVIPILEKVYSVKIDLKNIDLGNCRLFTRFNDEPIERVMLLIAETFSLTIESSKGRYLLDGSGCE